jgi:hypothetical protein
MGLSGAFTVMQPAAISERANRDAVRFMDPDVAPDRAFVNNKRVIAQSRFLLAERVCQFLTRSGELATAAPSVR